MQFAPHLGRTARRLVLLVVPLLVATTGTAAAYGAGSSGGGMMGGGGLFGSGMGLWGLFWMGLLLAIPLYLLVALGRRREDGTRERPLSILRERYARGDLSEDEVERRRKQLERTE